MIKTLLQINFLITKQQRKGLVYLVVLLFIGMILEVFGLGIIIPMINILLDSEMTDNYVFITKSKSFFPGFSHEDFVFLILGLVFILYLIKTLYQGFLTYKQNIFLNNVIANISNNLFQRFLNQPYSFHLNRNSSDLIKILQVEVNYFFTYFSSLISFVLEVGFIFSILLTLIMIEPTGAISVGIFYGVLSLIFFQFTKVKLTKWGESRQTYDLQVSKVIFEGLGGIKDLIILGKTSAYTAYFSDKNSLKFSLNAKMGTLSQVPRFFLELVSILGLLSFISIMLLQGKDTTSLITVLGVFVAAVFRLIPSINKIISVSQLLKYHQPSVDIIFNELHNSEYIESNNLVQDNFIFQNHIEFSNVKFAYNNKNIVLNNINLKIKRGQTIGIIGQSGSGKSTFIDLLVGLHRPTFGKISIDNIDNLQLSQSWRNNIGYVSQTIYLIDDSIKKNIALGVPDDEIDESWINKLLIKVRLEKFISNLEEGANTKVGERGVQLSGGQRQRIGLARALYNNPGILILDEATSSLDNNTEKEIMLAVNNLKKQKTIIIIAHRLSTLENVDQKYKIENSTIFKV
tara:strand:- start:13899 stop:15617 length:1719 start_codon:yes stop_codon:yes gene_type:complete